MSGLWQLLGIAYIVWPYVVWSDGLSNYLHWLDLVRDCSYKEYLALSGTRPDTAMRGPPSDNTGDSSSAEERQQLQGKMGGGDQPKPA